MSNISQGPGMPQANSAPEDLIAEVRRACVQESVPLCGENALQFGIPESPWALSQILTQTRGWASGHDRTRHELGMSGGGAALEEFDRWSITGVRKTGPKFAGGRPKVGQNRSHKARSWTTIGTI